MTSLGSAACTAEPSAAAAITAHIACFTACPSLTVRRRTDLFRQDLADTARNQIRDVEQRTGQRDAAGRREVSRTPDRLIFFLVFAQAFEMIKSLAISSQQPAELVPGRRERVLFQSRQRRHP